MLTRRMKIIINRNQKEMIIKYMKKKKSIKTNTIKKIIIYKTKILENNKIDIQVKIKNKN